MACFIVPAAEAVITSVATKVVEKHESGNEKSSAQPESVAVEYKVPFSRKLRWLGNMLWGGSALLAFEHLWHGEIVPWFPFLTAASDPAATSEMLQEMSTVGVAMAVLVTAVWAGMVMISSLIEKRAEEGSAANGQEVAGS